MTTITDLPMCDDDIYPVVLGGNGSLSLKERLLSDYNIPKVGCVLGKFKVTVAETIPYFQDADTKTLLGWVLENIGNMQRQVMWVTWGADDASVRDTSIAYMKGVIKQWIAEDDTEGLGRYLATTSLIWEHPDLWRMDYLYQEVKEVGLYLRKWAVQTDDSVVTSLTRDLATFMDTLRQYLYWSMRHEYRLRGYVERGDLKNVTPFPL